MAILAKRSNGSNSVITPGQQNSVLIKGEARCNHWRHDCWYGADQRYAVQAPPDPHYPDAERYAVELGCPGMNLRYPEGSLLLCLPLDAVEGGIEVDQHYLIERRRGRGGMQETELSVKTLIAESGNKPRFVSESNDPDHQISHPIFGIGDEKIRPIALVTGSLQPE
jgi:hypothetical protein